MYYYLVKIHRSLNVTWLHRIQYWLITFHLFPTPQPNNFTAWGVHNTCKVCWFVCDRIILQPCTQLILSNVHFLRASSWLVFLESSFSLAPFFLQESLAFGGISNHFHECLHSMLHLGSISHRRLFAKVIGIWFRDVIMIGSNNEASGRTNITSDTIFFEDSSDLARGCDDISRCRRNRRERLSDGCEIRQRFRWWVPLARENMLVIFRYDVRPKDGWDGGPVTKKHQELMSTEFEFWPHARSVMVWPDVERYGEIVSMHVSRSKTIHISEE